MKLTVNAQSSIRIQSDKVIYFDPFKIEESVHDADMIFITHDHYDHFSIEDIEKIEKEDTVYIIPECMYNLLGGENVYIVSPNEKYVIEGLDVYVLASYNVNKKFHPKQKGYVGYLVKIEDKRIYVAGDCDINEDNRKIRCDIAFVPVGGTYTMDCKEAAELINLIRPELAIPTHYGSIVGNRDDGLRFKEKVDEGIRVEILLSSKTN